MGAFADIVETMMGMDIFQLFFPWLLVLAVTYGLLEKYNVFADDTQVNGVIALSVAFFTIGGVYIFAPPGLFTNFGAAIGFSLFALIGYLILLGAAGYDVGSGMEEGDLPVIGALVLSIVSFIGVLAFQLDLESLLGGVQNTFDEIVMPILILIFLIIIVGATVGDSE